MPVRGWWCSDAARRRRLAAQAPSACVPRIIITPSIAAPGEVITLTSDTGCGVTTPAGSWRIVAAPPAASLLCPSQRPRGSMATSKRL